MVITQVFKLEDDEYKEYLTGHCVINNEILTITNQDEAEDIISYEIDLTSNLHRNDANFIYFSDLNIALSFKTEEDRDYLYYKIMSSSLQLCNLFKNSCDEIEKSEVIDNIIDDCFEKMLNRDTLILILNNGNERLFMKLTEYIDEVCQIFNCQNNYKEIVSFDESKTAEKLEFLYRNVFSNILNEQKRNFVCKIINHQREEEYKILYEQKNTKLNSSKKMQFISYCKKKNLEIYLTDIEGLLEEPDNLKFSEIFLQIAKDYTEVMRDYIEFKQKIRFLEVLKTANVQYKEKSEELSLKNEDIIYNLVFAITILFKKESSFALKTYFYKNIHKVFLKDDEMIITKYYPGKYVINHHKLGDLLFFMCNEHEYRFEEFFIFTQLNIYVKESKNEDLIFLNERLEKIYSKMLKFLMQNTFF